MAQTDYYVDYGAASEGVGTEGDPFKTIQYALDNITPGTDGDRLLLDTGTTHVLSQTLDLDDYGQTPTDAAPLTIMGDGGRAVIDGDGSYGVGEGDTGTYDWDHVILYNLEITNTGSSHAIELHDHCTVASCKVHTISGASSDGIQTRYYSVVTGCEVYDTNAYAIRVSSSSQVLYNWCYDGDTYSFVQGIYINTGGFAIGNMVTVVSAVSAIYAPGHNITIANNSLINAGSGDEGILLSGSAYETHILNNLIDSFSDGVDFVNSDGAILLINNSFYNCTSKYTGDGALAAKIADVNNEVATGPIFAKRGPNTFANRFQYFEPSNAVRGTAYPYST